MSFNARRILSVCSAALLLASILVPDLWRALFVARGNRKITEYLPPFNHLRAIRLYS